MKKIIPAIAILGSVAALVAYKIKKDEKKEIVDLDQDLLSDEDLYEGNDEHVEEGPISEPQSCCMNDAEDKEEEKAVGESDEKAPEDLDEEATNPKAK
ncbi:MAG: hypothetical protein RR537_09270 [Longicatena sp.]